MNALVRRADLWDDAHLIQKLREDPWPATVHRISDHISHQLNEHMLALIREVATPRQPQVCQNCKWPSCFGSICEVCCAMLGAVLEQPSLLEAHEVWRTQRLMRRMGLL